MAQCVRNRDFAIYAYIWPLWHTVPPPSKIWKIIFNLLINLFWDDLGHQIPQHSIFGVWHRIFTSYCTAYLTNCRKAQEAYKCERVQVWGKYVAELCTTALLCSRQYTVLPTTVRESRYSLLYSMKKKFPLKPINYLCK